MTKTEHVSSKPPKRAAVAKPPMRSKQVAAKRNHASATPAPAAAAIANPQPTSLGRRSGKRELVQSILGRPHGASMSELTTATGWVPHSVRAMLSGLRQSGAAITRSKDDAGSTRYYLSTPA